MEHKEDNSRGWQEMAMMVVDVRKTGLVVSLHRQTYHAECGSSRVLILQISAIRHRSGLLSGFDGADRAPENDVRVLEAQSANSPVTKMLTAPHPCSPTLLPPQARFVVLGHLTSQQPSE